MPSSTLIVLDRTHCARGQYWAKFLDRPVDTVVDLNHQMDESYQIQSYLGSYPGPISSTFTLAQNPFVDHAFAMT